MNPQTQLQGLSWFLDYLTAPRRFKQLYLGSYRPVILASPIGRIIQSFLRKKKSPKADIN